jgi:hypothetical protein
MDVDYKFALALTERWLANQRLQPTAHSRMMNAPRLKRRR